MSAFASQFRKAADETSNWIMAGMCILVTAFPYVEMFSAGVPVYRLVLTALASLVPAFLALAFVRNCPSRLWDRSTRVFFPPCAALFASASVSYPTYLMMVPSLA